MFSVISKEGWRSHTGASVTTEEDCFHEDWQISSLLCLSEHNPLLCGLDICCGVSLPYLSNSEDAGQS